MIRRGAEGSFWLIRQDDHAKLAGELAKSFGNAQFATLAPRVITAIASHDAGWAAHDSAPALSASKFPLDIFEAPRHIALAAWAESSRLAMADDPYVALLVTLHQLYLSSLTVSANPPANFNVQQLRQQFDLNKFQHAMIERLENLRKQLGLRTDRPLRLGMAEGWTEPAEEQLKFDFGALRGMDAISLGLCCEKPPAVFPGPLIHRPGGSSSKLQTHRAGPASLRIKPWPFRTKAVSASIPYRQIPAAAYEPATLIEAIERATPKTLICELRAD